MKIRDWLFGSTTFTPRSTCGIEGNPQDGAAGAGAGDGDGGNADDTGSVLGNAKADDGAAGDNKDQVSDADKKAADEKAKALANETPEQKTAREATEKAAKDEKTATTLKGYDALKLPDGLAKDHAITQEFFKDAAERGMSNEDAQAMITRMGPKLVEAINKPYDAWADMQKKWADDMPKDSEFGGKDYQANLGIAASAMDAVLGKDTSENKAFREMLTFTGAGNNPEMTRFLFRIGKMMKEGSPISGKSRVETKPLSARIYPDMPA